MEDGPSTNIYLGLMSMLTRIKQYLCLTLSDWRMRRSLPWSREMCAARHPTDDCPLPVPSSPRSPLSVCSRLLMGKRCQDRENSRPQGPGMPSSENRSKTLYPQIVQIIFLLSKQRLPLSGLLRVLTNCFCAIYPFAKPQKINVEAS